MKPQDEGTKASRLVADILQGQFEEKICGEIRGEEFGDSLQDISRDNAWLVCERIRKGYWRFLNTGLVVNQ